jgi:hypothetical protein
MHVCLGNPNSIKSVKLRMVRESGAKIDLPSKKNTFFKSCECGFWFRSENGYRMHREENETTKNRRRMKRGKRKTTKGNKAVEPVVENMIMDPMKLEGQSELKTLQLMYLNADGGIWTQYDVENFIGGPVAESEEV